MQPIISQTMKQPQYILFIRQSSVKHEVSIITYSFFSSYLYLLWQPLVTKTNSNTSNKSLNRISSRDHKRT